MRYFKLGYVMVLAIVFIVTVLNLISVASVYGCIDPRGIYAFEVVLNKPGVRYNLSRVKEIFSDAIITIYNDMDAILFKYRHLDALYIVMLYQEKFYGGAPYIERFNEGKPIEYYLGVRVEFLNNSIEMLCNESIDEANKLCSKARSTLVNDLGTLLKILIEKDVLVDLGDGDIKTLVNDSIKWWRDYRIVAGWNSRLIYYHGGWLPYDELVNKGLISGMLVRFSGCGKVFPKDVIDALTVLKPAISIETTYITIIASPKQETSYTLSPTNIYTNNISVLIAIIIGIVTALATYMLLYKAK